MNAELAEVERQRLIARAETAFAAWPQFKGSWDDWRLGRLVSRVYRFGKTFGEKDEYVLVAPEDHTTGGLVIQSNALQVEVLIRAEKVRVPA